MRHDMKEHEAQQAELHRQQLEAMSVPALEARVNQLDAQRKSVRDEMILIQGIIDRKNALAEATRKLTPGELAAVQSMKPDAIAPTTRVHGDK